MIGAYKREVCLLHQLSKSQEPKKTSMAGYPKKKKKIHQQYTYCISNPKIKIKTITFSLKKNKICKMGYEKMQLLFRQFV